MLVLAPITVSSPMIDAVADHGIGGDAAARPDLRIFAYHRAAADFACLRRYGRWRRRRRANG